MKKITLIAILFLLFGFRVAGQESPASDILPRLTEPIAVTDWWVVGPFLSGARESLTNPLGDSFDRDTGMVELTRDYPSTLQFGGRVKWTEQSVDENGDLVFNFDNPDWEKITDEWGASGQYFLGAAYSSFECDQKCEALVNGNGLGSFYINGRQYSGDPYGSGILQTPVVLDEGVNHVFLMTGGFGGSDTVRFEILPAPETELIVCEKDILIPDIVKGEPYGGLAGIPVLNTTNRWIENVSVNDDYILEYPIAPLTVVKVPIEVRLDEIITEWDEATYDIPIKITWDTGVYETVAKARVRNPGDSKLVTFRSGIDNSAQKYGILFPINYDPAKTYSLILTTHGAGVEGEGQVDAFAPKDWAFVVAPTNRRNFGFDWQDWGRLDAMEILDLIMGTYPIDPNRVYLIGHSMGGHGAWHIGCTHADRFAAVVPSAGWDSFQLYFPWFLRSDELFSDPQCQRIFDQCANADRTTQLLPNLRNVPVLAVHGSEDDDVPPTHARLLTGILEQMGYDVRLWEEPGQPHWWDTHPGIPGTDCVDALRIQSFCRERVRDPFPKHVTFVSYDLANNDKAYWLKVYENHSPIGRIYVDAEITDDRWINISTENVKMFSLYDLMLIVDTSNYRIRIDRQEINEADHDTGIGWPFFGQSEEGIWDHWKFDGYCLTQYLSTVGLNRGPIKRAYFKPFCIVVGQSGTPEQNNLNMEIARNVAIRWWYRANGYVNIIPDTELPKTHLTNGVISIIPESNLPWMLSMHPRNLILVGGPDSNSVSAMLAEDVPFSLQENGVWMGDEFIEGTDLACNFVYPIEWGSLIHCIWGNSIEGMRLSGGITPLFSGSNLPDFMVYDDDVRLYGTA